MSEKSKFIELAKKLKALAEQGVGGEKANAIKMLDFYCVKHDITPEELEEEVLRWREFPFDLITKQLIIQVIASVTGSTPKSYKDKRKKDVLFMKMSDAHFIECDAKIAHYTKTFKKQFDIMETAFFSKYSLFSKSDNESKGPDLTPEELAAIIAMMKAMQNEPFAKQLKA